MRPDGEWRQDGRQVKVGFRMLRRAGAAFLRGVIRLLGGSGFCPQRRFRDPSPCVLRAHRLSPLRQFVMIVIGEARLSSSAIFTRNRWPSEVTAYGMPRFGNSGSAEV